MCHGVVSPELEEFWNEENPLTFLLIGRDEDFHAIPFRHLLATLGWIVSSKARGAINASTLADVVAAAKGRQRRPKLVTRRILDGRPIRFGWVPASRCFRRTTKAADHLATLTLLAPSAGLIRKHWSRIPLLVVGPRHFLLESITPSNQLSYVVRVDAFGRSLLVTGDTGFVDFRHPTRRTSYYPQLELAAATAEVIQVAHHGGRNAHFYGVLLSGMPHPSAPWLIVSHARHDPLRPNQRFSWFVLSLQSKGSTPMVLFTAKPSTGKIQCITQCIAPTAGTAGAPAVQMVGTPVGWTVTRHST
jgi:hypothetical protein